MEGKCLNCGAQMALSRGGAPGTVQRCEFCGAESRVPGPAPVPIVPFGGGMPMVHPPPQSPAVKVSPLYYALPMVFTFGLVGFGIYSSMRAQEQAQKRAEQAQQAAMQQASDGLSQAKNAAGAAAAAGGQTAPRGKVYSLDELATATFVGWAPLNAPGLVGTLDAFDAIANMPWAANVGRRWVSDARITRVDFDRVDQNGIVAMRGIPDAKVTYRYVSPSRGKAWLESTALTEPTIETQLEIAVTKDGVQAIKFASKPISDKPDPEIKPPTCTLSQAFAALDKAKQLPVRPVYDVYLIDNGQKAPAYYFSTLTGSPAIPWVESGRCKL